MIIKYKYAVANKKIIMEFVLQEGEKIIEDIKPSPRLIGYFFFTGLIGGGLISFLTIAYFALQLSMMFWHLLWLYLPIGIFVGLFFALLYAVLRYSKQHYWITNRRIIYKRGVIGYAITSVPYNRISDVIISRSFLERLLGIGSVLIQTLAGQYSAGGFGAEESLLAIPDPEGTQKLIFELMKNTKSMSL